MNVSLFTNSGLEKVGIILQDHKLREVWGHFTQDIQQTYHCQRLLQDLMGNDNKQVSHGERGETSIRPWEIKNRVERFTPASKEWQNLFNRTDVEVQKHQPLLLCCTSSLEMEPVASVNTAPQPFWKEPARKWATLGGTPHFSDPSSFSCAEINSKRVTLKSTDIYTVNMYKTLIRVTWKH